MNLAPCPQPIASDPASALAPKRRILIVEDNALNLRLMVDLLAAHGYGTLEAVEGLQAIHLARAQKPDLILMDIQLPYVSGLEVTRWLKADERTREIPVIAVTAFAMAGDERLALDSGCDAYVPKPIDIEGFLRILAALLPQGSV